MKKTISIIKPTCLGLLLVLSCLGQNVPPPQNPSASDDEVVKISTTVIQVDTTVTDKNGKIISDLKAEDFEVFENNEKRAITFFSFVPVGSATPGKLRRENATAGLPTAALKPEQVRRTIALIVDDLTLDIYDLPLLRRSMRKFVAEQMRDGDLVAIARTGGSIGILEQFTSDRRQLYAAIEKIKWNPLAKKISASMSGAVGGHDGIGLHDPDQEGDNHRASVLAAQMINSLQLLVASMKRLPGRKSAIMFTEGFKISGKQPVGPDRDPRSQAAVEKLVDLAARSAVVLYTIDSRGLQAGEPAEIDAAKDPQDGMVFLAKQTGGMAILKTNDFNLGIEKILDSQKGYYLIGYKPDPATFNAGKSRFNKLTVKVKREGATVAYRSGFFGVSNAKEDAQPITSKPKERMTEALTAPFAASDIAVNLNTLFGNDAQQGSFIRSLLHINAKDLEFTEQAGGVRKADFDVLAISFDNDGVAVDKIVRNYVLTLPPQEYQRFLAEGFVYYFTFPVKKPGPYSFRVAIRDKQSQRIGSASQFLEVPDLKKDGLTLSGVVLETLTDDELQRERAAESKLSVNRIENRGYSNMLNATSLRHFQRPTILRYGFEVYNAKLDSAHQPRLTSQVNVFRDGKLVMEGKPSAIDLTGQADWQKVTSFGALALEKQMAPGEYILQIIVTDNLASGKRKSSIQFVQFEIV
jgi:VWFA-related protein